MRPLLRTLLPTLVLASCSFGGNGASAQPYYGFSQVAEAYQEIASGTDLPSAGGWAQINDLDGEQFPVAGSNVTLGGTYQLWVNDAGFFNIDNAPVSTVFLSALFTGFNQLVPVDANSSLTYLITGASGTKHLVVQWKNYRRADEAADHYVNFQVHLYQSSGVMEVRYGPSDNGGTTYSSANGPNAGYYFANYTNSVVYDRIWLTGPAATPTLNTALTPAFLGLNGLPADGTVYRYSPLWAVGIAEEQAEANSLFVPLVDPFTGSITIRFQPDAGDGTLEVMDITGRTIAQFQRLRDAQVLDRTGIPAGVYLLAFTSTNGKRQVERVVMP